MVDFIREKTRQYASDQSGAIRQEQMANNVKEWNDVIQGAGRIAGSIMDANAKAEKEAEKKAIEADQQMIDTQIGSKAQTELLKWNVQQIEAGVNPNSEEYTQKLYAKRDELYQPYIDQMTSEKGRNALQKQGLDTAERIRQSNIGQIAKNRQKAQARQAFADTAKNMQKDAKEFGKLGDWEGFKEATKDDRKAMVDYAKANGNPKAAEFAVDANNITNYLAGLSETEPESVVAMLGDKDTMKEIVYDRMDKEKPGLSDKQKTAIFEDMYKDVNQEQVGKEALLAVLPESVLNQYKDSFVAAKKEEVQDIKDRMKETPKGSKSYENLENRLEEAQKQIEEPEDSAIAELRSDLSKTVLPIAKRQIGLNKLQAEKMEEESVVDQYTMVLNPDTSVSFEAQMALALGQPAVEHLFQHSISDEEMHKAYDAYAQAKTDVLQQKRATFEGTQGMADKLRDIIANRSDNKIVQLKDMYEFLTEMHKAPITQEQWEDANNIAYGVIKDQVFGDLTAAVLEDNNRYFPDIPLISYGDITTGSHSLVSSENIDEIGLPSSNMSMVDIDSVKNYLDKETVRISKDAIAMLGKVAQMSNSEDRVAGVNQVSNFVANEKKKVYDNAMKTYGIDLAKLRENKRNFGQAFTTLGTMNPVEYMGDDPYSGKPLFRPLTDYQQIQNARKRILEGLEASKNQKGKKEE